MRSRKSPQERILEAVQELEEESGRPFKVEDYFEVADDEIDTYMSENDIHVSCLLYTSPSPRD